MKYIRLPQFNADYKRLSADERKKFTETVRVMIACCREYEKSPHNYTWPAALRFEQLTNTSRICAITWSFSDLTAGQPFISRRSIAKCISCGGASAATASIGAPD